jgi:hypothetical protein
MSLTRKHLTLLCALVFSAACANETMEPATTARGGTGASALTTAGSPAPTLPAATSPSSSGVTAPPRAAGATSGQASPATQAALTSSAGAAAPSGAAGRPSSSAAPAATSGSAGAVSSGAAGSGAAPNASTPPLPDLTDIIPPPSTPESRVPSPNNPAECPAMAPENPVGDCLGLPIYLECEYGTYYCVCDWFHWLCAG